MKKVLIVTPRSPFQDRGADEADRLAGITWFKDHGWDVRVITKVFPSDLAYISKAEQDLSISILPISYKYTARGWLQNILLGIQRIFQPLLWDGAAFEYFDKEIQAAVTRECKEWQPDLVWFDYTYLWPLYPIVRAQGIPIITRSINFEPEHFLDEDGRTLWNRFRAFPKYLSEKRAFVGSDFFFAITPKEEALYRKLGSTPLRTLPLRALPRRFDVEQMYPHEGVSIGFMPSTYSVHHNKEALRFIIEDVVPQLSDAVRHQIKIFVTGNKFPAEFEHHLPPEVEHVGFVPSAITFWQGMDIALAPSLFGAGMQMKIFEPISLGVPTITSDRGLGGYPFECGTQVVCASSKQEVARAIERLVQDKNERQRIGKNGRSLARSLFSRELIEARMQEALNSVTLQA